MAKTKLKQSHRILIKWLKAHGPDDWHQVVQSYNWDCGLEPLAWIAEQPKCDKATAQCLINLSNPDGYFGLKGYPPLNKDPGAEYWFVLPIIERWNADFYKRSELESVEGPYLESARATYRRQEARSMDHRPWNMPDSAFEWLKGRELPRIHSQGWPAEVEAELEARGMNFWND